MRYFTPELYLRFNSDDPAEPDRADENWDRAVAAYRRHLESIRPGLPAQVARLSELSLHDAQWLSLGEYDQPACSPIPELLFPWWFRLAVVSLGLEDRVVNIVYFLNDRVRESPAPSDWKFSSQHPAWLYDELHADQHAPHRDTHRILLSDGRLVEIPFAAVIVHEAPLAAVCNPLPPRQIA